MNYRIVSQSGWKAAAHTEAEAIAKADKHTQEWADNGAPRRVETEVFYFGQLVYTTRKASDDSQMWANDEGIPTRKVRKEQP